MTLLIIGAGGHGHVAAEVAEACGYDKIDFLDDNPGEGVVGSIEGLELWIGEYDQYFVGIGSNEFRRHLIGRLEKSGVQIATLIHPTAYISKSAKIGVGSIIAPKAIVNTHSVIGKGCILSVGAVVDHDVVIEDFVHVNAGTICTSGSKVNSGRKLEAGEVVRGY